MMAATCMGGRGSRTDTQADEHPIMFRSYKFTQCRPSETELRLCQLIYLSSLPVLFLRPGPRYSICFVFSKSRRDQ